MDTRKKMRFTAIEETADAITVETRHSWRETHDLEEREEVGVLDHL